MEESPATTNNPSYSITTISNTANKTNVNKDSTADTLETLDATKSLNYAKKRLSEARNKANFYNEVMQRQH